MSCRGALAVLAMLLAAAPMAAQTSRGDGSQTGDGSTPFTGLARAPEADMFVGSAQTAIPIQVPPGRKLTPDLALRYHSNGGASPYGYGWELTLPRVQRATKSGARTCGADRGEFVLTLPSGTIECTLSGGTCAPHVQESFARIRAVETSDGSRLRIVWHVWDASGVHYTFGGAGASTDGGVTFTAPARTGDDADQGAACGFGAAWQLTSIDEPNGNRIDVTWLLVQNVLYPAAIRYGGDAPTTHPFAVAFTWQARPDNVSAGSEGVAAVLTKRLERIDVRATGQVRAYAFTYAAGRMGRQSLLESVTLLGADGSVLLRADGSPAASTFLYHAKTAGFATAPQTPPRPVFAQSPNVFRWIDSSAPYHTTLRDVLDLNGDGFPDLVDIAGCAANNRWTVYFGSPSGFAPTAASWYVPNAALMCSLRRTQDGSASTVTLWATADLTGDGIPDFIDARTTPWTVYPGTASSASGSWGFGTALAGGWAAPGPYTQRSNQRTIINPGTDNNWTGAAVWQDLIDMNGDGRLDLVQTPGNADGGGTSIADPLNPATWTVYPNTGAGFGTGYAFQGAFQSLTFTTDNGANYNGMVYGTFDVNGDGLPDGVVSQRARGATYTGAWRVCVSSGAAMDACANWTVPPIGNMWRWIRASGNGQPADVLRDFIDINGDGLPDLVDVTNWNGTGSWQVFLNRGDGFEQTALAWPAPAGRMRDVGSDGQRTGSDTFDVDGDGLVDFLDFSTAPYALYHAADGAWAASGASATVQETGMHPDLLVATENGIGGATYLHYRPSTQWDNTGGDSITDLPFVIWTVTEIRRDDGLCTGASCVNPSSAHQVGTRWQYAGGRYDPVGRALRGFALVTSEELADPGTPHRAVLTRFHQTAALAGKVFSTLIYDGRGTSDTMPLESTLNTWECASPSTGSVIACPVQPAGNVWVRLQSVLESAYSSFSFANPQQRQTATLSWHRCGASSTSYGNAQDVIRGAVNGGPLVRTHTEYACIDTAAAYVVDRPVHVVVTDTSGGTNLQEKWFFYDGLGYAQVSTGNVTRAETWLDRTAADAIPSCTRTPAQGSGGCVSTLTSYDQYGNITAVTDALGRITATQYDAATHIYPVAVTQPPVVGQPAGYRVSRTYDPGCGTLLTETIPYRASGGAPGSQTLHQYDAFCRPLKTWRPGEASTGTPYREYSYVLGAAGRPSATSTIRREPNHAGGVMLSTVLADGLGRTIQEKSEAEVDGTPQFVATATQYDGAGRIAQQSVPFVWTCGSSGCFLRYTDPPAGTGRIGVLYDALARPIRTTHPDGKYRTSDYAVAWQTTTLDECAQAGEPCLGSRTVETRDALGRTVERWHYDQANQLLDRMRFDYDEIGRLIATTQGDTQGWLGNTAVTTTYDSLGRQLAVRNPDASPSADWQYGYDAAGNLRYQNDPKTGQHLEYCYDALNRITKQFSLSGDAFTNRSCAAAATVTYGYNETASFGLGQLAAATDEAGSMAVAQFDVLGRVLREQRTIEVDGQAMTAEMRYQYDGTGDHLWKITYPDGEVVTYTYDGAGRVNSMSGREVYLVNLTYDARGRPRRITHRNAVEDERIYAAPGDRLSQIETRFGSQTPVTLFRYGYTGYDARGRLTQLSDTSPNKGAGNALDTSATYTYDALGRLTRAQTAALGDRQYGANAVGNLVLKESVSFSYAAAKPHQPVSYGGQAFGHDANGNRTYSSATAHTFEYDAQDRLSAIDAGQVTFRYDYTGRRAVLRTSDGSTVRYFNDLFEASPVGRITKYYVAGGLLIAQRDESNTQFAAAGTDGAVRLATRSLLDRAAIVVLLRGNAPLGLAAVALFAGTALIAAPWRRRQRVVGLAVRRGHALGLALLVGVSTLPWPVVLCPDRADAECNPAPIAVHYHLDHLGSTRLLTDPAGNVLLHVRYTPYGEPRHYTPAGQARGADPRYRREFTGYETELNSGLLYAGARFYDPVLGMFLTHDPARQFASPYTYGNWDPVNGTDPNGTLFGIDDAIFSGILLAAIIGTVAGATAAGIQALVNGATPLQAFKAAGIGGAIGAATGAVSAGILQPALGIAISPIVNSISASASSDVVAGYLLSAGGLGQAAYATSRGDFVGGSFGIALTTVSVLGLALSGARTALGKTSPQFERGDATLDEFDLRAGDVLGTSEGMYARTISLADPSGGIGHTQMVASDDGGELRFLTSDEGGQRIAGIGDRAVSGRGYIVYRPTTSVHVGGPGQTPGLSDWIAAHATGGGLGRYLGRWGGNVCSSTCNSALQAGGIDTGYSAGRFVTPNQLVRSPALVRVGRIPLIP
jgi:RHS repeat-associated protein